MSTESHAISPKNSRIRRYLPYIIAFLLIQAVGATLLITAYNHNVTLFLNEEIRREAIAYDHNNFIRDLKRNYVSLAMGWAFANLLLVSFLYYANKQTIARAAQVETLAQTNKQLANEIAQRIETETHLREARLLAEQAQETAETANRAKSTFLASMSHELRTPLNGILGYTQLLLLDSSLNSKQKQGVEIIQNSGEHLLLLLNGILDVKIVERETAVLPTTPTSPPSIRGIDGKKPLILVVDDHPGNRRLLIELLTPLGFTVITNDSGQAALETVAKERPHLILMDLVMPEMDGYETVRRLRKQSATEQEKRCPIIAISGNAFAEDRNQSLEAGCDDFIAKPFKAELLLAMIEKHLGSSWGWLREDNDEANTKQNSASPVPPPSPSIAATLLDFAKVGDVRGLKKQVDRLLDEEEIAPETAAMFNKLMRNYQLSELQTLLQSYLV